jgi:hypothetical protein
VDFPNARKTLSDIEDPDTRAALEIDPRKYYPPDVYRTPNPNWPKDFKIDIKKMLGDKIMQRIKSLFGAGE